MRSKIIALLCVFICVAASLPMLTDGQSVDSISIIMVGESRRTGLDGNDLMVAGIFHNFTVSLSSPADDVTVLAYSEETFPNANYTNTYLWSYQSGTWSDDLYDYYLNASQSMISNGDLVFNVAIDTTSKPGYWRKVISINGLEMHNGTFFVEEPRAGLYMSAPTFSFRIMPYGTGYINSYVHDDPSNSTYLTTRNIGNTPLDVSITYDIFNSLLGTTNSTGVWHPGEERRHYVDFQAQSWSPRRFQVNGIIHGIPRLLATPETISCTVTPQTSFDVVVTVARQGYEVFQLDGITIQYKPLLTSKYQETIEFDLWATGTSNGYLGAEGDKVTVDAVKYLGEDQDSPILLSLSEETETQIIVNVTCSVSPLFGSSSMIAHVNFSVELVDFTNSGTFQNIIIVAAVSGGGDDGGGLGPPSMLAIALIVIMLVAVLVFTIFTSRKAELKKRRELEDRIRRKKEKARKIRKR